MPTNRVRFQKELSISEFFELYGTEQQYEQAVV
jgi:DNA polymerase sigma